MTIAGCLAGLTLLFAATVCRAAERTPVLLDDMDGDRPVLQLIEAAQGVQLLRQAVEHGDGEFGKAEHLSLVIPPGASAALAYPLPEATVLPELRLEAWAWCSRPGMQLAAIVVLPRSIDESTGQPRQLLVRSGVTAGGGGWQRLVLEGVPKLLERHARVARAKFGPVIDEPGAYVSQLVILAPGGTGNTDVWVDKVALYGALRPRGAENAAAHTATVDLAAAWSAGQTAPSAAAVNTPRREPPPIPRIIQWQGEPLELLQRLGFNTIWMARLPSAAELGEANRLGLWLVCPPPMPEVLESQGVGPEFDAVLAWDLGELAHPSDVPLAEEWARALERHDRVTTRPTVLRQLAMPREASRLADVVVLGRPTQGSTATWLEQGTWLMHERRLARAGAAMWYAVDTHRSAKSVSQLAALRGGQVTAGAATYGHLCRATTAAVGAWPRGFLFQSQASLAAGDAETRMRCLALELTNMRLAMIEPWLARGKAATAARKTDKLTAMVLTVERSHLVVPMKWGCEEEGGASPMQLGVGAAGGYGAAQTPYVDHSVTLVLPGVPESCVAYLLTVAGPRQAPTRRVTGGLSVTVPHLPDDAFLLLTEDGYAFTHVERYLRRSAPRAAQARVELATLTRQQAVAAAARLTPALLKSVEAQRDLAVVDASMTAIHGALSSQDYAAAFARAEAAEKVLDDLSGRLFRTMWPDGAAGASPLRDDWATLPDMERVAMIAAGSTAPRQLLPGGEFENLDALLASGWRRSDESHLDVTGTVRLSPDDAHAGAYCLELSAAPVAGSAGPPALAAPPVWIQSPPLSVPAGNLVEITGWARVAEAPLGSADPLLVFDSIGGDEGAVRIAKGPTWSRFRLVRAAPAGAECRVTIALGGVGRVAVDSLEYRLIPLPAAGPVVGPVARR